MKKLTIGFIGNFSVPFSTENERKWSFEQLGHDVITFQENETKVGDILMAMNKLDMLMYSHTHGWKIERLQDAFEIYKKAGIPTVSAHLDRWAWLDRVKDVGKEATWFTEYIFMADASPEAKDLYDSLKLKWHWLKPGVVERDCYMAVPDRLQYPHEIIFVGSKNYHPEYPWRPMLVEWLKFNFGDRFAHYGGGGLPTIRGAHLNTLYASAKIVIGDSCFAGQTSNYWSDRIPETTGRGGFLIHPMTHGCDHKGIAWFKPGDVHSLLDTINYYYGQGEQEREAMRIEGFEWTKNNRTYTHLAQEMLSVIFPHEQA